MVNRVKSIKADALTSIASFDTGTTGAFGIYVPNRSQRAVMDLPTMGSGSKLILNCGPMSDFLLEWSVTNAIIEIASSFPKQGVSSTCKFCLVYGQVIGMIQTMRIPHEFVTPGQWKREMKVGSDKEVARRRAIELFPDQSSFLTRKSDHNRAEALLLGEWYWRKGLIVRR